MVAPEMKLAHLGYAKKSMTYAEPPVLRLLHEKYDS